MNYTYARDRFELPPKNRDGDTARTMRFKASMNTAGRDARPRIYRGVPRIWHSPEGSTIDRRRQLRREQRNAAARGAGTPALFTAALQRALPRSAARGLAKSIARYSAMFVFSKAVRIRAGKR